jgi:hypothetical protein
MSSMPRGRSRARPARSVAKSTVRRAPPGYTANPARTRRRLTIALTGAVIACLVLPAAAEAHGPIAPVALSYLAKVTVVPAGLDAKVVDGDLRMWLQAPADEIVVVLDYRGAPYLRFSASGVEVNENSSMYYLNITPVAESPPLNLTAATPPDWHYVSSGHSYEWHDGRLGALAAVALAPGTSYVGRWNLPLRIDGRLASIYGGLWHAPDPSLAWFWPMVVIIACVIAAWRVRRARLDLIVARGLAVAALAGIVTAELGLQLHGRPTVTVFQLVELAAFLAFVSWSAARMLLQRAGYFTYFLIGVAAVWAGAELVPTLLYGYVLIALPAFLARAACVVCLGSAAGLLLLIFRLFEHAETSGPRRAPPAAADDDGQLSHAHSAPT